MEEQHELLTEKEVRALFRVTSGTVMRWARQGKIPFILTPGGRRRYPYSLLVDLVANLSPAEITVNHDSATVNYGSEFSSLTDD